MNWYWLKTNLVPLTMNKMKWWSVQDVRLMYRWTDRREDWNSDENWSKPFIFWIASCNTNNSRLLQSSDCIGGLLNFEVVEKSANRILQTFTLQYIKLYSLRWLPLQFKNHFSQSLLANSKSLQNKWLLSYVEKYYKLGPLQKRKKTQHCTIMVRSHFTKAYIK